MQRDSARGGHQLSRIKMKFIDSRLADWFAIVPDWEGET
jgi:hypothetical protein